MTTHVSSSLAEGQSTNQSPLFNGACYNNWKEMMRIYIQAVDYELWRVISNETKFPRDKEGKLKDEKDCDDADFKLMSSNSKAMNVLYCALNVNDFKSVSSCDTAQEIWLKLLVSYQGTNQVK